ncbi:hypothetical protein A6R68_16121 [Neotoma lepida]|uniref:Uncharacterized protein n=1 Tax=Neotoma lepida TaxID=56216 RepID=A0A1A6HFP7_NEOLE|nr:hypothetical protein A6R68_16121 [Neotoma lepida]
MLGSSSVAARKVVQQLQLEAGLTHLKNAQHDPLLSVYKSLQTPESLLLFGFLYLEASQPLFVNQ